MSGDDFWTPFFAVWGSPGGLAVVISMWRLQYGTGLSGKGFFDTLGRSCCICGAACGRTRGHLWSHLGTRAAPFWNNFMYLWLNNLINPQKNRIQTNYSTIGRHWSRYLYPCMPEFNFMCPRIVVHPFSGFQCILLDAGLPYYLSSSSL